MDERLVARVIPHYRAIARGGDAPEIGVPRKRALHGAAQLRLTERIAMNVPGT